VTSLNTSEATILLSESNDYKRLATAIYGLTGTLLLYSGMVWILKIFLCSLLLFQLRHAYQSAKPSPAIHSLTLKQDSWVIHHFLKADQHYENAQSLVDTGFFQLIVFKGEDKARKTLVLFHDQITHKEHYVLQRKLGSRAK
jgi:hypothetical protein